MRQCSFEVLVPSVHQSATSTTSHVAFSLPVASARPFPKVTADCSLLSTSLPPTRDACLVATCINSHRHARQPPRPRLAYQDPWLSGRYKAIKAPPTFLLLLSTKQQYSLRVGSHRAYHLIWIFLAEQTYASSIATSVPTRRTSLYAATLHTRVSQWEG